MAVWLVLLLTTGARAEETADLVVHLRGMKHDQGQIILTVFAEADADAFPTQPGRAAYTEKLPIHNKAATLRIAGIPHGRYAISVIHDENGNDTLDTNFLGIPNEPLGSSNGAKGFMGPPSFEDAAFRIASSPHTESITLK